MRLGTHCRLLFMQEISTLIKVTSSSPNTSFVSNSASSSNSKESKKGPFQSLPFVLFLHIFCILTQWNIMDIGYNCRLRNWKTLFHSSHGIPRISNQNVQSNGKCPTLVCLLVCFYLNCRVSLQTSHELQIHLPQHPVLYHSAIPFQLTSGSQICWYLMTNCKYNFTQTTLGCFSDS